MPLAGPGALARAGRVPLHRGEAPLGQADRPRPSHPARPGALHPVRPVHPFCRGDGRRADDRLLRAGRPHRGRRLPGAPFHFVLQRQHGPDLPGGGAHLGAVPLQGAAVGFGAGRVDVHVLLGRLPDRGAVVRRLAREVPRDRCRARQPELAVRPGPLRLRSRPRRRPPHPADDPAVRGAHRGHLAREPPGGGRRHHLGRGERRSRLGRHHRGRPVGRTRTLMPGRSWPVRSSGRTTSTPSSATACRPSSCRDCPGRRSTTPAAPSSPSCSPATCGRSFPSSTSASATPRAHFGLPILECSPVPTCARPRGRRHGDLPAGRCGPPRLCSRRRGPRRGARRAARPSAGSP